MNPIKRIPTPGEITSIRSYLNGFFEISDEVFAHFTSAMLIYDCQKGLIIQKPGDTPIEHCFVISGTVRSYFLLSSGLEVTDFFYAENSIATEYEAHLTGQPAEMYLECIEPTVLLAFTHKSVVELYPSSHAFERLGRLMAEYGFCFERQRSKFLQLLTPMERYAYILANEAHFLDRYPSKLVASYLAITPESFSRIKKRFI